MSIGNNHSRFIFSRLFNAIIKSDPLVLADAGARGELQYPWRGLKDSSVFVLGFEPDKEECKKLNQQKVKNRIYLPTALWSLEGTINIHISKNPGASSVYPPDMDFIKRYCGEHWEARITDKVVEVKCTTLDKVLEDRKSDCDFLKIDTQGSEFEILSGAAGSLKEKVFGVLVETWTSEVHKGQRLSGDILVFMKNMGFSLFDINIAAAWRRRIEKNLKLFGKRQVIGLDFLFFKDADKFIEGEKKLSKVIKAAAISDVYGFPGYALELLNSANSMDNGIKTLKNIKDNIIHNSLKQSRFYKKYIRALFKILGVKNYDFPSLHY